MRTGKETASADRGERGTSLVEMLLVVSVLLVAFTVMSQALVASMGLTESNRGNALAMDGLQQRLELMSGVEDFRTVFPLFNDDPTDDPPGVVAPGGNFQVFGLEPTEDDPDGFVGETVFPTLIELGDIELREDVALPELGMPRDLDGDGDVDDEDRTDDYELLPVILRVRFRGQHGPRELELHTLLADR